MFPSIGIRLFQLEKKKILAYFFKFFTYFFEKKKEDWELDGQKWGRMIWEKIREGKHDQNISYEKNNYFQGKKEKRKRLHRVARGTVVPRNIKPLSKRTQAHYSNATPQSLGQWV